MWKKLGTWLAIDNRPGKRSQSTEAESASKRFSIAVYEYSTPRRQDDKTRQLYFHNTTRRKQETTEKRMTWRLVSQQWRVYGTFYTQSNTSLVPRLSQLFVVKKVGKSGNEASPTLPVPWPSQNTSSNSIAPTQHR